MPPKKRPAKSAEEVLQAKRKRADAERVRRENRSEEVRIKEVEQDRARRALATADQKQRIAEAKRNSRANMTQEQQVQARAKDAESHAKRILDMTDEERLAIRSQNAESTRRTYAARAAARIANIPTEPDVNVSDIAEAEQNQAMPPVVQMAILQNRNSDQRRYNAPRVNEVAVVFQNENGEPPLDRDLLIHCRVNEDQTSTRRTERINVLDPNLDPMVYPLLFPYGDQS